MKHLTFWFISIAILLCAIAISTFSQQPTAGVSDDASITAQLIATRTAIREAVRTGDTAAWERLVSQDCRFVEPSGRITGRNSHAPVEGAAKSPLNQHQPTPDVRVSQTEVRSHGDTAVVIYREDSKARVGDATIVSAVRFTEIYRRNHDRWILIASAETPIAEKKAVSLDLRVYDDYVGEYQMASELVGKVYRQGDKLMLIGTGWKQAYELLPLGHDTFFVKEMADNEIVFIRDHNGKVIAQGPGENSQGPTGTKIK